GRRDGWDGGRGYARGMPSPHRGTGHQTAFFQDNAIGHKGNFVAKLCRSPLSIRSSLQSQIANRKCHCLSSLTQIQDTFGVAGRPWCVFGTPLFGCLTAIKPNVYRTFRWLHSPNRKSKSKIKNSRVVCLSGHSNYF